MAAPDSHPSQFPAHKPSVHCGTDLIHRLGNELNPFSFSTPAAFQQGYFPVVVLSLAHLTLSTMTQQTLASPSWPPTKPQHPVKQSIKSRNRLSRWLLYGAVLFLHGNAIMRLNPELEAQAISHSTKPVAEVRTVATAENPQAEAIAFRSMTVRL
ncbi:hypothetical protein IQ273_14720 [Nodosilinea sp. LEGE 07298]|uniref:hypothetical protein n=1 Tax=Nodosilinea sp. LEGE 07298 TaxID=2777970 RepID=UPI00187F98BA|nr:hypothetical protein [Nodosilinea sp. LEGE 07298]MBE9110672.1 hypothetical protein [Nodosilinea sp. LEGE 07298]